jgi:hypothetical protein
LGFATWQEARKVQRMLLNTRMAAVERYMRETFPARLAKGEVAYRRPANPQPPILEE